MEVDDYNNVTFTVDFNKLLVPTAPAYHRDNANEIVSGYSNDVGVATGMVQSFYDARGIVTYADDGSYGVYPGSQFREGAKRLILAEESSTDSLMFLHLEQATSTSITQRVTGNLLLLVQDLSTPSSLSI